MRQSAQIAPSCRLLCCVPLRLFIYWHCGCPSSKRDKYYNLHKIPTSDVCPTEGMGLLFKRKPREKDEVTDDLVHRNVYRLAETYDDKEAAIFKKQKVTYSFWSAVKYTLILSFLLWWLPIIGQMIAGYVGGRRAGTPWRGVIAALIPLAIIFAITGAMSIGFIPTVIFGVNIAPGAVFGSIAGQIPIVAPYMNFAASYLNEFVSLMQSTASLRLDSYLITVAFAYIGGILSDQTRRELEYVSHHGSPNTTVVVEGNTSPREKVSPRPSWSLLRRHSASNSQAQRANFGEMRSLGASTEAEEEELRPLRSARRMIDQEETRHSLTPRERKQIEQRAHAMVQHQKHVEKTVQRRSNGSSQGLVSRASKSSVPKGRHVLERTQTESGDWEFV